MLTFDESNKIWSVEWYDRNLASDLKIVLLPCHNDNVNSPEQKAIPQGAIKGINYSYEYDKIPIGTANFPTLEIEFTINHLNDGDGLLFAKTLFNRQNITKTLDYYATNIIHIYVGSQLLFVGMQIEETIEENTVTIKYKELGIFIFEIISKQVIKTYMMEYLANNGKMILGANYIIDYYNQSIGVSNTQQEGARLYFTKLDYIDEFFEYYCKRVAEGLLRGFAGTNSFVINNNYPVTFYKRNYESNIDEKGDSITYNDLWVKAKIEKEESDDISEWITEKYNSASDYYFDLSRQFASRVWFAYSYNIQYDIISNIEYKIYEIIPTIFRQIDDYFSLKRETNRSKILMFSYDIIDDTGVEGETALEGWVNVGNGVSRNKENYEISYFWHNIANAGGDDKFMNNQKLNKSGYNHLSLLYFDGKNFVLVHPLIDIDFNGKYLHDYVNYTTGIPLYNKNRAFKKSEFNFYYRQKNIGVLSCIALTILFNHAGSNNIKVKLITSPTIINYINQPTTNGLELITNSNEPFQSISGQIYNKYMITKIDYNIYSAEGETGQCEIEGVSINEQ